MKSASTDTQYARTAKRAYELVTQKKFTAEDAWIAAAKEIITSGESQKKGCPKHAFIGLCEFGNLQNIKGGEGHKTSNYQYADYPIKQWKINPLLTVGEMWQKVYAKFNQAKNHNGQLHVALGLKEYWK